MGNLPHHGELHDRKEERILVDLDTGQHYIEYIYKIYRKANFCNITSRLFGSFKNEILTTDPKDKKNRMTAKIQ